MTDHLSGIPAGPIHTEPSGFHLTDDQAVILRDTLRTAGVELGAYDEQIVNWLSRWDWSTVAVITSWVVRAAQAREKSSGEDDASEQLSPLARAENAKRARDIGGELAALQQGHTDLTSAPWYPNRPGDLVHVHYEAGGLSDAFGETYLIAAGAGGFLSMQLLCHTLPDTEDLEGLVGCFAVDDDPDPLMELWFEAGPHRLTIVRDGRPVHIGATS